MSNNSLIQGTQNFFVNHLLWLCKDLGLMIRGSFECLIWFSVSKTNKYDKSVYDKYNNNQIVTANLVMQYDLGTGTSGYSRKHASCTFNHISETIITIIWLQRVNSFVSHIHYELQHGGSQWFKTPETRSYQHCVSWLAIIHHNL